MAVDAREIERLRWRSRRGLLELDILFERFWENAATNLKEEERTILVRLLAMPDNDVLDMVMGRTPCPDPGIESVIRRLQAA